jgi:hypothetical protein
MLEGTSFALISDFILGFFNEISTLRIPALQPGYPTSISAANLI